MLIKKKRILWLQNFSVQLLLGGLCSSKKIYLEPKSCKFQEIIYNNTLQKYEALFEKTYDGELEIEVILSKIEMIDEIVRQSDFVSKALEDEVLAKPAIMMHLTAIAEQFSKLQDEAVIEQFDSNDIEGDIWVI